MNRLIKKLGLSLTAATMCRVLGVMFLFFLALGLAVSLLVYPFEEPLPYTLGLLLGFLHSLVKVALLERMLEQSLEMEDGKAKNYASAQFLLRYLFTIVILLLVVFLPRVFGMVGVIIGLLSLQASAYITARLLKNRNLDEPSR